MAADRLLKRRIFETSAPSRWAKFCHVVGEECDLVASAGDGGAAKRESSKSGLFWKNQGASRP